MAVTVGRRRFVALVGSAAAWSIAARAQQPTMPVVGFLGSDSPASDASMVTAFHQGLDDAGYVEGRNVAIEYRWADGQNDRLPKLAADLVQRRVDVIAALGGDSSAFAVKAATTTIPVVSAFASDPVRNGFVDALTRPGHNFTGVYRFGSELEPKRLQILCEVVPKVALIDMLVNPNAATAVAGSRDVAAAARPLERRIRINAAQNEGEIDEMFATLSQLRAGALLIMADPYFTGHSREIGELANRHAIPAIYTTREFVSAGGLMSYTVDENDASRLVGRYVGRILKGEKPSDLPVQQSAKIELTVNLKSAKALGIVIPPALLAGAAEVIE